MAHYLKKDDGITGPPAFISSASSVYSISAEELRKMRRNEHEQISNSPRAKSSSSPRTALLQLARNSIRRQFWRAASLQQLAPRTDSLIQPVRLHQHHHDDREQKEVASQEAYQRLVVKYSQIRSKARKARQLDNSRVANLQTIASLVASVIAAEKSGPTSTSNEDDGTSSHTLSASSSAYGSGVSSTLPNYGHGHGGSGVRATATMMVTDNTLGLCAPPRHSVNFLPPSSAVRSSTNSSTTSLASAFPKKTMSTQPKRRTTPTKQATADDVSSASSSVTGLTMLQHKLHHARELEARCLQSSAEEATFWRWVETAVKEEEEEAEAKTEDDAKGEAEGEGDVGESKRGEADIKRTAAFSSKLRALDGQVRAMVPMLAQLEEAVSTLFASGAVRQREMAAIASRTQQEVREAGLHLTMPDPAHSSSPTAKAASAASSATSNTTPDWLPAHPAYASLLALYADSAPRSVATSLASLRAKQAATLAQAARACEAAECPFEFVFDSDVVRLGGIKRG